MTVEEIKEKILSNNSVNGWLVDCYICNIIGDITSGCFGVICDIIKTDVKKKRQSVEHWHYSFTDCLIDEISFISETKKRL